MPSDPRDKEPTPDFPAQRQKPPGLDSKMDPLADHGQDTYKGSGKLQDMVAIVTGGDSGIGRAVAVLYAREGADVAIVYLNEHEDAKETQRQVEQEGRRCLTIAGDIGDEQFCRQAVQQTVDQLGRLDILVNNAGVGKIIPFLETTEQDWDFMFGVNCKGLLWCSQAAARVMIAQGRGGKIINMASQAGRRGEALVAVYCATKAAVISFTQSAGLDLIRHRINVNGIAPGVVESDMWDHVDALFAKHEGRPLGEKKRLVGEAVPYGRMGVPEDLCGMAVFLASAESDYVVAQTYNVDGGNWMS